MSQDSKLGSSCFFILAKEFVCEIHSALFTCLLRPDGIMRAVQVKLFYFKIEVTYFFQ